MNRLSMMGELAASLAHEITQPIATAGNNARAAMRFLDRNLPDLGEVREALECIVGDAVKPAFQRMSIIDLVVPISADQEQVLYIRLGQQRLDQVERCDVEPLQVVEEDRRRMFRPGENVDESPKYQLETPLRVLVRKLRDGGLFSDNSFSSGTRSAMSRPFGPNASRRASRQPASSASLFPRSGRIRL